jgi:hypothetical protein
MILKWFQVSFVTLEHQQIGNYKNVLIIKI